jgi:hypothetical protein
MLIVDNPKILGILLTLLEVDEESGDEVETTLEVLF